ncbi:MAG: ABC transporter substrate-binding protein [Myxococcota bacterium]
MGRALGAATFLSVGALLSACQGGGEPLVVAYAAPQTGADRGETIRVQRLLEHYFEEVNRAGGVAGRRIELRIFDDRNEPQRAQEVAADVAESPAFGVIGHRRGVCSLAAGPIYAARGLPAITPSVVRTALVRENDWYFGSSLNVREEVLHGVAYIREAFAAETFSIVYVDIPELALASLQAVATATSAGLTVDARHALPSTLDRERVGEVVAALSSAPEEQPILLMTDLVSGSEVVRQLRDAGVDRPLLGSIVFASHRFHASFEGLDQTRIRPHYYTDGIHVLTPALIDMGSQKTTKFARWYAMTFRERPSIEGLLAADAAMVFVEAVRAVLSTDPNLDGPALRRAVRDWISKRGKGSAVEGVTGPVYFDEGGQRVRSAFLAELQGGRIISAPTQLRVLPRINRARDLPPGHDPDRVVRVGASTLYRTDIVYAGFKVHELGELDEERLSFEADLDMWFRHRAGIDGWNVQLLNASEEVVLGDPVEYIEQGGVEYRRFRIKSRFEADVIPAPYGRHTLGFALRHPYMTSDSMIYAFDFVGLDVGDGSRDRFQRFKEAQALLPPNSHWLVYDGVFFQDKLYDTTRGRLEADGHPAGRMGFSRLSFGVRVQRSDLSPRTLTPSKVATPTVLVAFLITLLLIGISRTGAGQRHLGVLWFLQVFFAAILLLASEKALGDMLSTLAPSYYQQAFSKLFGVLWWMVPALFIHVAIYRFLWLPIERESKRKVPSILSRMVALTIYLLAIFGVLAFVFDEKLTSLLATSGVFAMIIGLAIQINIANIFSGIAINMERPFRLGDWIMVHGRAPDPDQGIIGEVIDINWRTTRLKTTDNSVIVIPNAVISEKTVTNFMLPDEKSRFEQIFYLDYAVPHERGLEMIGRGLTAATKLDKGPLADPKPKVRVNAAAELGVEYLVRYWLIPRHVSPASARHAVTSSVLEALREHDLDLAYPRKAVRQVKSD